MNPLDLGQVREYVNENIGHGSFSKINTFTIE